jgi:hypothetical protein
MAITTKLKRYELIITKVETANYPTLAEIYKYLQRFDLNPSGRTLQRDLEELKSEFNIDLVYDKKYRGYYIERNTITDNVIQFIKNMSLQANLLAFSQSGNASDNSILKDENPLKGLEHIPLLLRAVQHQLYIEFTYQKFYASQPEPFILQPYGLKEYMGRWYIVGLQPDKPHLAKFGVDRILELKVTERKFKRDKKIDLPAYFSRMIGIIDDGGERETVQLQFTAFQANYIRTLPLHWSQQEISTDKQHVVFDYFILTNHELMQRILSYGSEVKVLKPARLAALHKRMLKEALNQYK